MENELNNTETAETSTQENSDVSAENTKEVKVEKISFCKKYKTQLVEQFTKKFSLGEILAFFGAFAVLPLVDLATKSLGLSSAATQSLYILIPALSLAAGYTISKTETKFFGTFFHSLASISILMVSISLFAMIPGLPAYLAGTGSLIIGMIILAVIFSLAAAFIKNTGSSYTIATIAALTIAVLSIAQLISIPCGLAFNAGKENAQSICTTTTVIQTMFLPIVVIILGFLYSRKVK